MSETIVFTRTGSSRLPTRFQKMPGAGVVAPLHQRLGHARRRLAGPAGQRVVPRAVGEPGQRAEPLGVDAREVHVLVGRATDAREHARPVAERLVHELAAERPPGIRLERVGVVDVERERVVVDRAVVEPALEAGDDRQQRVAVGVARAREVAVVTLERLERLAQERRRRRRRRRPARRPARAPAAAAARSSGSPNPGPALAEVPVVRVAARELAVPEDDMGNEAVAALPGEQPAQLLGRALRVEARPDDRVEARVPEPLERVRLGRRHAERVRAPALDGGLRVGLEQLPGRGLERHPDCTAGIYPSIR